MGSGYNLQSLPKSHSASPQPPAQLPSSSSLGSLLDGEDIAATPSKPLHKKGASPRRGAKKSKVKDERYEEDLDEGLIPTDVTSRKRPRRSAAKKVELEAEAKDPEFNPKNSQDADPINYPSLLTSQARTRRKTREAAEKAEHKALTLADEALLAREEAELEDYKVMTIAQAERRQIKNESDGEDRKDERRNESDGGDISPFVVKPGFWDGLRIPEQGSNDDDGAVSKASGEGESLISDFEPEDEFNFCE